MGRVSQRKLIRKALETLLKSHTSCEDRVYLNRFKRLWDEKFPAMMIYTLDEPVSVYAESPRELERKLKVSIEIIMKDGEKPGILDDILDDVCQEVEDRMKIDHTLGELCRDVTLQSTEYASQTDGEKDVAAARMTYEVQYYTEEVALDDDTDLPNFSKLKTKIEGQIGDGAVIESELTIQESSPEPDPEPEDPEEGDDDV